MSWLKLDDSFADHPKVLAAGKDASVLFTAALCYCGKHLTDGRLGPRSFVARLSPLLTAEEAQPAIEACLAARLFEEKPDGTLWVHDFTDYNPTREATLQRRRGDAERQRRHREERHERPERRPAAARRTMPRRTAAQTAVDIVNGTLPPTEIGATVLARMNVLAGTRYRARCEPLEKLIEGGASKEDLLAVVEHKRRDAFFFEKGNFKPDTLFSARNFPRYLDDARSHGAATSGDADDPFALPEGYTR